MKYKASLDTFTKATTAGAFILFGVLISISIKEMIDAGGDETTILNQAALIALYIIILASCYLFAPKAYVVDDQNLIIVRPAWNKIIKLSDIASARPVSSLQIAGTIRTFGVGGLFGWYGKFYAYKTGSMTFYATQKRNKILIMTKQGEKMVITPDDISLSEKLAKKHLINL